MKKYIGLIAITVGIVALIGGAGLLYNRLTADYQMEPQLLGTESSERVESEAAASATDDNGTGEEAKDTAGETNPAIDFTVEDAEGNEVTLFSFIENDKPIVLNFWASWCGPCKNELPDFQAAYEVYEGEVQFLMVNMTDGVRETKEIAMGFMEENGYTLPVYYDTAQEAAYTYAVYSLPTTYFISAEGELTAMAQGMIDAATLEKGISMIYTEE